jgi:hypothetical protein
LRSTLVELRLDSRFAGDSELCEGKLQRRSVTDE